MSEIPDETIDRAAEAIRKVIAREIVAAGLPESCQSPASAYREHARAALDAGRDALRAKLKVPVDEELDELERDLRIGIRFAPMALKQTADVITALRARVAELEATRASARERIEMARLLADTGWDVMGKTMDYSPIAIEAILRHLDTALAALAEGKAPHDR